MTGRDFRFPDPTEGTTFSHISDTHMGEATFTQWFVDRLGTDIDGLAPFVHGHVHTGDCVHWGSGGAPEDDQFVAWLNARKAAATGTPWCVVPGNHDLASYMTGDDRTWTDWATATGLPQFDVQDIGDVTVIALAGDSWVYDGVDGSGTGWGMETLSDTTLTWLDGQLSGLGSRPVWLAFHSPLDENFGGTVHLEPIDQIASLIGSHSNVVGTLSGHVHVDYRSNVNAVRAVDVGGRQVFVVNGPPAGGTISGVATADHQWHSPVTSIFVTYLGDEIHVRWRSHLDQRWDLGVGVPVLRVPLNG